MSADIVAIVLAAGSSSRMWPLGDKHLLRFAGSRLIERHLWALSAAGVRRAIVVGNNENGAALAEAARSSAIDAAVIEQKTPQGMAGAVLDAMAQLGESGLGGPVYVTQPHDVVEDRLHAELLAPAKGGAYARVAAVVREEHVPAGYLRLDGDRVTGIVEKPAPGSEPSNVVTIVAHLFTDARPLVQELQRQIQLEGAEDSYERALGELAAQREVRVARYDGVWQPIKYPWHVLDVMQFVLEEAQRGEVDLAPHYTQIEPGVFAGEDVRVFPGGHIAAPAIIGKAVVLGNNALVRESIVGDGCAIGFGSEVARSYLAERVQLHHNYVGDSVLDRGVLFGFGTITANFRLDEKNVKSVIRGERIDTGRAKLGVIAGAGAKIGVGTNVMPGVKIGANATVGPGQVVMSDVPDGARLLSAREDVS